MTHPPIAIGFDDSSASREALEWALDSARLRGLAVEVVYALAPVSATVPPVYGYGGPTEEVLIKEAEAILADATAYAKGTASGVEVTTLLARESAVTALMKRGESAQSVVVGSRGLGTFGELLLGSTSVQLAAHGTCPTVVVRPTSKEGGVGPHSGRVVVGIDGSPLAEAALALGLEEASLRGVGLTALCAWDIPYLDLTGRAGSMPRDVAQQEDQEVRAMLGEIVAGWQERYPDVDIRRDVVASKPVDALVDASRGAELLVVGSRGRGGFRSLLLGSVSHAVLHHAHCTTIVVHPNRG
jgi:nucleotide-binding universal stress UspA family protein